MSQLKETKEVVIGFIKLAALLAENFKDGIQVTDVAPIFAKLQADPLKTELMNAYNNIDMVKEELKDVEVIEVLVMLPELAVEIKKLMEAVKK